MIEVTILIPVRSNNGEVFTAEHHAAFEAELLRLFGGYTLFPNVATGAWVEAGHVYHDNTRIYAVFLVSLADGAKVAVAIDYAKAHYAQLAITFRYLGLSEIR